MLDSGTTTELACPYCSKECTSKSGLTLHVKQCSERPRDEHKQTDIDPAISTQEFEIDSEPHKKYRKRDNRKNFKSEPPKGDLKVKLDEAIKKFEDLRIEQARVIMCGFDGAFDIIDDGESDSVVAVLDVSFCKAIGRLIGNVFDCVKFRAEEEDPKYQEKRRRAAEESAKRLEERIEEFLDITGNSALRAFTYRMRNIDNEKY